MVQRFNVADFAARGIDGIVPVYPPTDRAAAAIVDALAALYCLDGVSEATRATAVADLAAYDLLHFAAHTELNQQAPWRSSVVIGPVRNDEESWRVHADEMAALSLRARLVVLSACESARGMVLYGEGLQGLSSAFLAVLLAFLLARVSRQKTPLSHEHFHIVSRERQSS